MAVFSIEEIGIQERIVEFNYFERLLFRIEDSLQNYLFLLSD